MNIHKYQLVSISFYKFLLISLFIFFGVLLLPKISWAATYYIDYISGSDTKNGLSTTTPWKRHPFMNGFTGSYSHSAGDQFIFKGGVTWPSTSFALRINISGASDKYDYYGVDQAWFSGASWSRPIFDGEKQALSGVQRIISFEYGSEYPRYITIDNIEIKGLLVNNNSNFAMSSIGGIASYIRMKNLYVHGWWYADGVTTDGGQNGGITFHAYNPFNTYGTILEDSEISGADSNKAGGTGAYRVETIINSKIHDIPNVVSAGCNVIGSTLYNSLGSFDAAAHENLVYIWGNIGPGSCLIYNNIIRGSSEAESLYFGMWSSSVAKVYVYNNLLYGLNPIKATIDIDEEYAPITNNIEINIWNNTIQSDVGVCIRYADRDGTPPLNTVTVQNNHCIGTQMISWEDDPPNKTESYNFVQPETDATSQGFTLGNLYSPNSGSVGTVDQGKAISCMSCTNINKDRIDVSRPQGAAWDIGAYEYVEAAPPDTTPPQAPTGVSIS